MKITSEDLKKVGVLARLEVGEDEVGPLTEHFNSILDYFGKLDELDLSGVDPFTLEDSQPLKLRKDEVVSWEDRDSILNQSPSREGDFIRVPRIGGDS
nr:Asp-tRNA(Asn)/Glu-tRNA(Gln) amidotransferase subunit GatC [uncultured Dethiosulfovibrio sp.]